MRLLKMFSNSLFAPKEIVNYRNDKWYITLLYFLILVLLIAMPQVVLIVQHQGIDYSAKKEIRTHFNGGDDIPFHISDGVLVHDQGNDDFVYTEKLDNNVNIVMTTGLDANIEQSSIDTSITVVFRKDGVYLLQSVMHSKLFSYNEYNELNNIDFSEATDSRNLDFWDTMFYVAEQELEKVKPFFNIIAIVSTIIITVTDLVFIALLLSLFQMFLLSRILTFGKIFKLVIYLLSPYAFGNALAILFGFGILYYVGFIMSAIYVSRMARAIISESMRGR